MKLIDVARMVRTQHQAHLVRERTPGDLDAKPYGSGSKRGWVCLDAVTASAVVAVHDALKPENQAKFSSLPVEQAIRVTWKLVA
jgi:hypothetical protein